MLSRVLEPEVMDSPLDAADYDAMDHAEVNRRFVADLLAACREKIGTGTSPPPVAADDANAPLGASPIFSLPDGPTLDLGVGTAQIPIELCRQWPAAQVLGVDLAHSMLARARQNVERAGLADRIRLELADAKRLPHAGGAFAAVISNSIVHHIPEPRGMLAEALRVTAPGGLIFIRDLMRPASAEQLTRLVDAYAAGCNDHQRQLFADSLRAALSLDEIRCLVESLGGDPADVQATSDRHWTWKQKIKTRNGK